MKLTADVYIVESVVAAFSLGTATRSRVVLTSRARSSTIARPGNRVMISDAMSGGSR